MAQQLKAGDKCPQCKEGLLERSEEGMECTKCDYELVIAEVVAANERAEVEAGEYIFKPKTFKITVETPDEAEEFLRGLILARQNNNSEYFPMLIDAINAVLEPYRGAKLQEEMAARG